MREGYLQGDLTSNHARLTVAPLTLEDAEEVYCILAAVEGLASYYAAELPADARGRLTIELRVINADLNKVTDGDQFFELDQAFHRRFVVASGRPRVIALHDATRPQAERYLRTYTTVLTDEMPTSVTEHNDIIRAVESGDPHEGRWAVETNYANAAERLCKLIHTLGERGSW